ncbi:MAG: tRNA (guanosine(37)-N1)-methyltransferase TrmD [Proteobacteria bacterium]|nr:tRNA (guanosine(37)-N1)-methyltransferase TrmD [Pseudomonadota bacterium]
MHFIVLTLYPEIFSSFLGSGLIRKAQDEAKITVETINFRKHGIGKHCHVDAPPYGGGAGMLLRPEPIVRTLEDCETRTGGSGLRKILISPQGKTFDQDKAREFSRISTPVVLVCGRFEGFDERIRHFVDEEISLGDFVLMGGEVAAMAIIESVVRLVPGVIGNRGSLEQESFSHDLLEYSQYTRPYDFEGHKVPEVLLSGNHGKIKEWCEADSLRKTREKRSDIYRRFMEKETRVNDSCE